MAEARDDNATLAEACARGDTGAVSALISGRDVNAGLDGDMNTALHYASNYGHETLTRLLLDAGADPNVRTQLLQTPLMLADSPAVAALLLRRAADPFLCSLRGLDALGCAKQSGRLGVAAVLEKVKRNRTGPQNDTTTGDTRTTSTSSSYFPDEADSSASSSDYDRQEARGRGEEWVKVLRELETEKRRRREAEGEAGRLGERVAQLELERLRLLQRGAQAASCGSPSRGDGGGGMELPRQGCLGSMTSEALRELDARLTSYQADVRAALMDTSRCIVCREAEQSAILLPCKHQVLCGACAERVETCPLCRASISERFTPFKS